MSDNSKSRVVRRTFWLMKVVPTWKKFEKRCFKQLFRVQHFVIQGPVHEQWISGRPVLSEPCIVHCKCNYTSMSERGNVLCNYRYMMHVYCPRLCEMSCKILCFYREDLLKLAPNPQVGRPPLVGCPRLLIQYIRSYPPHWRPFLHSQPEDTSCRDDRDPLIIVSYICLPLWRIEVGKLWAKVYEVCLRRETLFWPYKGRKYIAVNVRGEAHVVMFRTLCLVLYLLKHNDIYIYIYIYICRTAALTSRRYILNIYSTNIHTEYFKHAA